MNIESSRPGLRQGWRSPRSGGRPGIGVVLMAAIAFCGLAGPAAAVNGEFKGSAVGNPDHTAPTFTVTIDTEYTTDGVRTIPSGNVRDLDQPLFANQDKGVGLIVDAIGVVITNTPSEAYAAETATQVTTTAFSQLNCGLTAGGQRFCLGSMSTMGETRLRGKTLVVDDPGDYWHFVSTEGCLFCSATVSPESAFTASVDNDAIVAANALLTAAYPALEPIELTWAFEIENIGNPGAVHVTAADGYDVIEVVSGGPLVSNVTHLAEPAAASYIFTPELIYWNGMWIYCDGGVLSRDTCRLA